MASKDTTALGLRNEISRPISWLEDVEKIRGRMLVIEGLLASMVLDESIPRKDRLGKALQCTDLAFESIDRLSRSIRFHFADELLIGHQEIRPSRLKD